MRRRDAQAGLTLVELMISMLISSIAISAALTLSYSMMNNYREHKAALMVERAARVSMEILGDNLRNAVPGVPDNEIEDYVGCTGLIGLGVTNSTSTPDSITVVYGSGGAVTSLVANFAAGDTELSVENTTNISVGDYVVVTNVDDGILLEVEDVDAANSKLLITAPSTRCSTASWPAGDFLPSQTLVIRAKYAQYFVESSAAVGGVPTLMAVTGDSNNNNIFFERPVGNDLKDAEPVAEGIEDLQIEVGYDVGFPQPTAVVSDGTITGNGAVGNDDEVWYNHPGDTAPVPVGAVPRAVKLTVIARSIAEQSDVPKYTRPGASDRGASGTNDEFRRRAMSTVIEIRNLQGSP